MTNHLMDTYNRLPITFERGEGAWLWDTQGNKHLDALSGIAVCGLGHAHPAVTAAISEQAARLVHTSNIYGIENQVILSDMLARLSGMDRMFFGNSGAEANEAAIKLARRYGHQKNIKQPAIVVMEGSFHGRTLATLTASGNRKIQAGFEPLVQGFVRAPFNDLTALDTIAKNTPNVVAVLVEPIQGEAGIRIPAADYLEEIRQLCDQYGWLMMLDEIQTGMCRSGEWFAFQHSSARPDVMTLAKALGNGVPIGVCLARGAAAEVLQAGNHGSTFGGNPLACQAAIAVLNTLEQERLVEQAAHLGEYILNGFHALLDEIHAVADIRGQGLMLGIELDRPCAQLMQQALEKKLLINVTSECVIRLLPPLIISRQQADFIINSVSDLVKAFLCEN